MMKLSCGILAVLTAGAQGSGDCDARSMTWSEMEAALGAEGEAMVQGYEQSWSALSGGEDPPETFGDLVDTIVNGGLGITEENFEPLAQLLCGNLDMSSVSGNTSGNTDGDDHDGDDHDDDSQGGASCGSPPSDGQPTAKFFCCSVPSLLEQALAGGGDEDGDHGDDNDGHDNPPRKLSKTKKAAGKVYNPFLAAERKNSYGRNAWSRTLRMVKNKGGMNKKTKKGRKLKDHEDCNAYAMTWSEMESALGSEGQAMVQAYEQTWAQLSGSEDPPETFQDLVDTIVNGGVGITSDAFDQIADALCAGMSSSSSSDGHDDHGDDHDGHDHGDDHDSHDEEPIGPMCCQSTGKGDDWQLKNICADFDPETGVDSSSGKTCKTSLEQGHNTSARDMCVPKVPSGRGCKKAGDYMEPEDCEMPTKSEEKLNMKDVVDGFDKVIRGDGKIGDFKPADWNVFGTKVNDADGNIDLGKTFSISQKVKDEKPHCALFAADVLKDALTVEDQPYNGKNGGAEFRKADMHDLHYNMQAYFSCLSLDECETFFGFFQEGSQQQDCGGNKALAKYIQFKWSEAQEAGTVPKGGLKMWELGSAFGLAPGEVSAEVTSRRAAKAANKTKNLAKLGITDANDPKGAILEKLPDLSSKTDAEINAIKAKVEAIQAKKEARAAMSDEEKEAFKAEQREKAMAAMEQGGMDSIPEAVKERLQNYEKGTFDAAAMRGGDAAKKKAKKLVGAMAMDAGLGANPSEDSKLTFVAATAKSLCASAGQSEEACAVAGDFGDGTPVTYPPVEEDDDDSRRLSALKRKLEEASTVSITYTFDIGDQDLTDEDLNTLVTTLEDDQFSEDLLLNVNADPEIAAAGIIVGDVVSVGLAAEFDEVAAPESVTEVEESASRMMGGMFTVLTAFVALM